MTHSRIAPFAVSLLCSAIPIHAFGRSLCLMEHIPEKGQLQGDLHHYVSISP